MCVEAHCRVRHPRVMISVVKLEAPVLAASVTNPNVSVTDDSDLESLDYHSTEPSKKKLHQCPDCQFQCSNSKLFYKHCKTHVTKRPYLCEMCNQRFRDMKAARQHHRCTHGNVPDAITFSPLSDDTTSSSISQFVKSPTTSSEQVLSQPSTSPMKPSSSTAPPSPLSPSFDDTKPTPVQSSPVNQAKPPPSMFHVDEDSDELPDLEGIMPPPVKTEETPLKNVQPKIEDSAKVATPSSLVSLENYKGDSSVEFSCCHCGHKGDSENIGEHIRSRHRDMPFIVRKSTTDKMYLERYQYKCIYCPIGNDSLMAAVDHWVGNHVRQDFQFSTDLQSSQLISGGETHSASIDSSDDEHRKTFDESIDSMSSNSPARSASIEGPPPKRARLGSGLDQVMSVTSASEDDMESDSAMDSDFTTPKSAGESKLYRCSSCRRTSKVREEIQAHILEKVNFEKQDKNSSK